MAADSIEERVFRFVARERATKRDKLSLSSRLNQDLGMDGDDAVEFFEKFRREFHVDLSALTERWSEFFGPEGVSAVVGLVGIASIAGCLVLAGVLERIIGFLALWAWDSILIACFLAGVIYWVSRRDSPFRAITVGDLVDAARAGKWEPRVEQNGGMARSSMWMSAKRIRKGARS